MSEDNNHEDLLFNLLVNSIAVNMFIGVKFGEEGAAMLASFEEQVGNTLKAELESQVEQGDN